MLNESSGGPRRVGAVVAGLTLFALAFVAFPNAVFGCRIEWRPHEEVEADADLVVEAVIVSAEAPRKSFSMWEHDYRIKIEGVRRGYVKKKELEVTFYDTKAHRRGTMVVCPVKGGTGIENELEVGQRYELFLESSGKDPELLLARAMAAESEDEEGASGGP